jgi:hypothetical protein
MVSLSIRGMTGWVNPYSRLPSALGPSSSHGGGLRALFFVELLGALPSGGSVVGGRLTVEQRRA